MKFHSSIQSPQDKPKPGWWFVFRENDILVRPLNDKLLIPLVTDISELELEPVRKLYLGSLDDAPCYSADLPAETIAPEGMSFEGLRGVFGLLEEEVFWLAGRSFQLLNWDRTHQYCGKCGFPTENKPDERAKVCSQCGNINYPSASPAVIVAVRKEKQILLAHSNRHPVGRYSVLAGFVELGETLEECVKREVREEVGLDIKNIRYFGSQSWPFPNSLMIGFTAEYAGGEITVDHREILDAKWFSAGDLPQGPPRLSIARRLIESFAVNLR